MGTEQKPPWLTIDWLLSGFDVDSARVCSGYARFVADGIAMSGPWGELKNQIYLGSERFVEQMQHHIGKDRSVPKCRETRDVWWQCRCTNMKRATQTETERWRKPIEAGPTACLKSEDISESAA